MRKIIILIIVIVIIGGGFWWWQQSSVTTQNNQTKNWQTYQNNPYRFKFDYPKEWNVTKIEGSDTWFINKTIFTNKGIMPPPLLSISITNKDVYHKKIEAIAIEYKNIKNMTVDNYSAEKQSYFSNMLNDDVYLINIEKDDNIYSIHSQNDDDIFQYLVDSFQFMD